MALNSSLDTDLFAWAKRLGGVDPLDKEEAVKTILRSEYDTKICTSFFDKTSITSSDPQFPSIKIRAEALSHVLPADLIAWATQLGAKPDGKKEAMHAILRHDYDEKTFQTWFELVSKQEEQDYARRQANKIAERYAQLQTEPTSSLEIWSHLRLVARAVMIVAILKSEYDASTFNTWADFHGVLR